LGAISGEANLSSTNQSPIPAFQPPPVFCGPVLSV